MIHDTYTIADTLDEMQFEAVEYLCAPLILQSQSKYMETDMIHDTDTIIFWDYADTLDGMEYAAVEYLCAPYVSHSYMLIPLMGGHQ